MTDMAEKLPSDSAVPAPALRFDRAWGVVAGAGLLMFINLGPVLYYTSGIFIKAISDDTGWTRGTIAAASLPANLLITLTLPLVGWAVDAYGTRRIALLSSILFIVGMLLLGQFSKTPGQFALLLVVANACGFALTPLPYAQIVSGWFDKRRGLALGLMLTMSGLGTALFPPLSSALIAQFGWRNAYAFLGLIVFAIGAFAACVLLRDPPQLTSKTSGHDDKTPGLSVRSALTGRAFWTLFAAFFLISIAIGGGSTSLPLVLTDRGVSAQQASFVMTIVGLTMMIGRLSFGLLLDRVFAPRLTALVFLAPALAFSVLLLPNATSVNAMIAAAFLGFGLGAEVDALAYIASRSFGLRYFGRILGFLMIAFTLGLAFGPTLFGKIFDQFQNYHLALWIAAGISAVASGLIMTLRKIDLPFTPKRAGTHT
ncbi:MFS transporter [Bradyrhizobium commune]|uniref:MFS transporter n=1 Tax=Bradyrhizobium commune TaxID=83627 RepID=A0A7S9D841_9BRAD|nr:MFS transporter [Bradyrhizobium commune]QPF92964.1 MFS transporter [Bradyrhizobium commune]